MQNRKYNIRGIIREVKAREKEERLTMNLINQLSIQDLKANKVDTIKESYAVHDIDWQDKDKTFMQED